MTMHEKGGLQARLFFMSASLAHRCVSLHCKAYLFTYVR
jgi:hypothetical protein